MGQIRSAWIAVLLLLAPFSAPHFAMAEGGSFEEPEGKFLLKPFIEVPGLNLELRSTDFTDRFVVWTPNYRAQTGVSLSYAGLIGASISAKSEMTAEDELLKGRSTYTDFRFRFPWRRVYVEVGYQRLKGFYAENTASFDPGYAGYLRRPDLSLESKYASVIFTFTPDQYSLAAAFDQSERQISPGGSWLLTLQVADALFEDEAGVALIPTALQSNFPNESLVIRGSFISATAGGGYGYMWTYGETGYAFAQLLAGVGLQSGRSSDGTREFSASDTASSARIDLGAGSNGNTFVGGVLISFDQTSVRTVETELAKRNFLVHVFAGVRF